ncbi:hypothetical protein Scep_030285 [Stephania cephalantha]|uniref:DUF4283 domain-containing protein n=1 Tax=Stephania cephalantha TaxID=152367 RepID=A0AAP0E6Z1_9MAGN
MADDLYLSFQYVQLEQKENSELLITEDLKSVSTQVCNLSLLGRLATQRKFNKNGLKDALLYAWDIQNEDITFIEISDNLFQICFKTLESMNYVLESGPWLFNDHIFLVKKWSPDSYLDPSDINSDGVILRKFLTVQIEVDVNKPLMRRKKIKSGFKPIFIEFKYERIKVICHICGKITHLRHLCDQDHPLGQSYPYSDWMLVEFLLKQPNIQKGEPSRRRTSSRGLSRENNVSKLTA